MALALLILGLSVLMVSDVTGVVVQLPGNRCELPRISGMCRAYIPSYYFNERTSRCQRFVYGGCGGNDNRFSSLQECVSVCQRQARPDLSRVPPPFPSSNPSCNQPQVSGPCRAYFRSFSYNPETGQCQSFVYGGCRGNSNRFQSLQQCASACITPSASTPDLDPVCLERAITGRCRARLPRWFYNADTRQCQPFSYGGCGGNGNNFRSQEACRQRCNAQGPPLSPVRRFGLRRLRGTF